MPQKLRKEGGVKMAQSKSLWLERQAISEKKRKKNREIDACNSLTNSKYAQGANGVKMLQSKSLWVERDWKKFVKLIQ